MKKLVSGLGIVAVLCLGYVGFYFVNPAETVTHSSFGFNPENKSELVGASDNVFVGEVVKNNGNISPTKNNPSPETSYKVKVTENLKGEVNGTVEVRQFLGYEMDAGKRTLVKASEHQSFLEEGKEYIFLTGYAKETDIHYLIAGHGYETLNNKEKKKEKIDDFHHAVLTQVKPK
jgi:hypothetical protein